MSRRSLIAALATTAVSLTAAPAALAATDTVGSAAGPADMNVCVAQIKCTYVNYANGKPTDIVRRSGTLTSWTVNTASAVGTVRLRVLRPGRHGSLTFVRSSGLRTIADDGRNTFSTHLKVRRGDVLALSNDTSGLYFKTVPDSGIRYFNFDQSQKDGASGKPDRQVGQLRLLLSAKVKH